MPIETAMPYTIIFHDLQFLLFHFILYVKYHHIVYNQSLLSDKKHSFVFATTQYYNEQEYIFFSDTTLK